MKQGGRVAFVSTPTAAIVTIARRRVVAVVPPAIAGLSAVAPVSASPAVLAFHAYSVSRPAGSAVGKQWQWFRKAQTELLLKTDYFRQLYDEGSTRVLSGVCKSEHKCGP
jgi:hypothetical protein